MECLEQYLKRRDSDARIVAGAGQMPTVEDAAQFLGVDVRAIIKSIVLYPKNKTQDEVAVAVLAGDQQLDFKKAAQILEWKVAKMAPPEMALERTGFPVGGTAPVGHPEDVRVLVDVSVTELERGYGGGGKPELLLEITGSEIVRLTNAIVTELSK